MLYYFTLLYYTMLYYTILYYTTYYAILYYILLYIILYYTLLHYRLHVKLSTCHLHPLDNRCPHHTEDPEGSAACGLLPRGRGLQLHPARCGPVAAPPGLSSRVPPSARLPTGLVVSRPGDLSVPFPTLRVLSPWMYGGHWQAAA